MLVVVVGGAGAGAEHVGTCQNIVPSRLADLAPQRASGVVGRVRVAFMHRLELTLSIAGVGLHRGRRIAPAVHATVAVRLHGHGLGLRDRDREERQQNELQQQILNEINGGSHHAHDDDEHRDGGNGGGGGGVGLGMAMGGGMGGAGVGNGAAGGDGMVPGKASGVIDANKWCALCERDGHESVDCPFEEGL